jgi:hypothetical protein
MKITALEFYHVSLPLKHTFLAKLDSRLTPNSQSLHAHTSDHR